MQKMQGESKTESKIGSARCKARMFCPTPESRINLGVRLSIFELFLGVMSLLKWATFLNFLIF